MNLQSFIPKDSIQYRLLLCLGVGFGTLLGLSPFSFLTAGILASISCLFLFLSLDKEPFWKASLWLLILSQILNYTTFPWIPGAVSRIAGTGPVVSILFFLFYGIISHLKFFPFYILFRFSKLGSIENPWVLLVFPAAGALADLLTYQIFPWYWGNLVSGSIVFEQFASIAGVYGLSFLLLFLSSVFLILLSSIRKRDTKEFRISAAGAVGIVFIYAYGLYRIGYAVASLNEVQPKELSVVVIQPDTSPGTKDLKADSGFLSATMSKVLSLALQGSMSSERTPSLIVIPESSIPFHGTIDSEENRKDHIYSSTMEGLILYLSRQTGADVLYNELNMDHGKLRNQISLFKNLDGSVERYNKRRLLAFGEYLPLEEQLPFLRSVFRETSRYVPGETPRLLIGNPIRRTKPIAAPEPEDISRMDDPNRFRSSFASETAQLEKIQNSEYSYSILPLLCYEAMFTELVLDYFKAGEKPEILINITNDSWFDSELEAHQHSGTVRLRAIETGRPLIRSTVSGITEVWDARGIALIHPIGFHETSIRTFSIRLDSSVSTVYTKIGNAGIWILCILAIGFRLTFILGNKGKV